MLDKSIPYFDVLMKREKGTQIKNYKLPEGFEFVLFKNGDEKEWAEIEASVGEFNTAADALAYFSKNFLPYIDELERRCIFIRNDQGEKVATLTIWWRYTGVRRVPWLHWVAVKPEYQGLGLGKAIVSEGMKRFIEIEGDRDIYLHTQTWSYKAINIYRKLGFEITAEKGIGGYENNNYEKAMALLAKYLR
ncbi:MAG TPA: GNAT family N-acetyltransferase [Clostridiaceae bacterium]|nr:GNAT family N-acetyltransferase [Clostridiaceae bacterium]